jgi:murein DD-endopeptidase MepM/ murein hydrolase activator NlpD
LQDAMILHRVSKGDSLSSIAAKYAASPYEVRRMNRLACPDCLVVGQQLRIPIPHTTPFAASDALPFPLVSVRLSTTTPQQGDVLIARVQTNQAAQVEGQFGMQKIHFTPDQTGREGWFIGMAGIDALLTPGTHRLVITATTTNGYSSPASGTIYVRPGQYIRESVSIDSRLTPLLNPDLNDAEESEITSIYSEFSPQKWWNAPFSLPVTGKLLSGYGNRRVYNGVNLGTYHSGYDISSPSGISVKAAAPGRVVAVRQFDIRGLTVVIDHGHGVFTGYFHLSQAKVSEGQFVYQGDIIGAVGTTGRSQGPHVHFDLAVGGVTVDPGYWIQTALP